MERLINSSLEKQTIYEIFRACRLCGGGAGYKMPIIQNVVDFEDPEVELKRKIKECVQIDVHPEDKMPPLICELCVDKINDFYEFLEMCRQINKRTRLRLGLPPQTMPQESSEVDNCILGDTEPIYINDEDSNEPLSKQKSKSKPNSKNKKQDIVLEKKQPELRVKLQKDIPALVVSQGHSKSGQLVSRIKRLKSPSPKLSSNSNGKKSSQDEISIAQLQAQKRIPRLIITKGILKKEPMVQDSLLVPMKRRLREQTPVRQHRMSKRVKITTQTKLAKPIKHSPRLASQSSTTSSSQSNSSSTRSLRPTRLSSTSRHSSDSSSVSSEPPSKPTLRSSLDSKPASKVASKQDPKTTTKMGPKTDLKPAPKPDPKPASKPEPKVADKPDLRAIPKAIPKADTKPTLRNSSKPEPKPASKPDPKLASKPEPKPVHKAISKPDLKPASKPVLRPPPKDAPSPDPKPAYKVTSKNDPKPSPKRAPSPPPAIKCIVCTQQFKNSISLNNHLRAHTVLHTNEKFACNACQEWFKSIEEAEKHHKWHVMTMERYNCRQCFSDFATYQAFLDHVKETCIPIYELPDVQCHECWRYFETDNLRDMHKCPGEDGRPGGKCEQCKRTYATLKSLNTHKCLYKKFVPDPALTRLLKPVRIRTARCDPLLVNDNNGRYSVSHVDKDFGFDTAHVYPFKRRLPFLGMVKFHGLELDGYGYVHWDSDDSDESSDTELSDSSCKGKNVDKLSTLSLKTIFSNRFLGKVPKKRRKLKLLESSHSLINETIDDNCDDDNRSRQKNDKKYDDAISAQSTYDNINEFDSLKGSNNINCDSVSSQTLCVDSLSDNVQGTKDVAAASKNHVEVTNNEDKINASSGTHLDENNFISNDLNKSCPDDNTESTKSENSKEDSIRQDLEFGDNINHNSVGMSQTTVEVMNTVSEDYKSGNEVVENVKLTDELETKEDHYEENIVQTESVDKSDEQKCPIQTNALGTDLKENETSKTVVKDNESNSFSVNDSNENCQESSDVNNSINGEQSSHLKDSSDDGCDIEMDDKTLMDELDAQIGENDNNKNVECEKSKIEIDVTSKKDHSMDLDSISDNEFDF